MMWGIALGGGVGLHSFFDIAVISWAADAAIKGFALVATGTWFACRYRAHDEKKLFDAVITAEMRAQTQRRAASAAATPGAAESKPRPSD